MATEILEQVFLEHPDGSEKEILMQCTNGTDIQIFSDDDHVGSTTKMEDAEQMFYACIGFHCLNEWTVRQ